MVLSKMVFKNYKYWLRQIISNNHSFFFVSLFTLLTYGYDAVALQHLWNILRNSTTASIQMYLNKNLLIRNCLVRIKYFVQGDEDGARNYLKMSNCLYIFETKSVLEVAQHCMTTACRKSWYIIISMFVLVFFNVWFMGYYPLLFVYLF